MIRNRFHAQFWLTSLSALLSANSTVAFADHGGCPCALVAFDNASAAIAEPAQRAVILWNGESEWLLLSTDVAVTGGQERPVVEFIPLPSSPSSIRAESNEMMGRVAAWGNAQHIALPNLTRGQEKGFLRGQPFSVGLSEPSELAEQLTRVCVFDSQFRAGVTAIAASYLRRGFAWFAIDQIDVGATLKSFPPISYVFASEHLYYPLETSTMAVGDTRIELLLITPSGVADIGTKANPIDTGPATAVSTASLGEVDAAWPAMFSQDSVAVQHVVVEGKLRDLRFDLLSK